MHLKLDSLQKLLDHTIIEEQLTAGLRAEVSRVLGPAVIVEGKLDNIAIAANDRLDVLDRTGRSGGLSWDVKTTSRWINHANPEIRKLAARTVPERLLGRLTIDRHAGVRAIVASRVPLGTVREMVRRFPTDDQLRSMLRSRSVHEAGVPKPKTIDMGHDPTKDKKPMGQSTRSPAGPDPSDLWYKEQALRLMREYGGNLEYAWEETAVRRFCASSRSTSGVEIDEAKLLKNVKDLIKKKEDNAMKSDALKETMEWLDQQEALEELQENAIPQFRETVDPVADLLSRKLTTEQYLSSSAHVFRIQESIMPLGIRKYRLGEGNAHQTMVPCIGMLPHSRGFRAVDERALDVFCETWNKKQGQEGEPLRLMWSAHPGEVGKISFTCSLR